MATPATIDEFTSQYDRYLLRVRGLADSTRGLHRHVSHLFLASRFPDGLIAWIQHPQALDPRSAMPDLGVNETDARNIAAYLLNAPR